MTSYNRDGKVGPWAREKLDCLGRYLREYTKIMKKQDWCRGYYYFDAFAGAGRNAIRQLEKKDNPNLLPLEISSMHSNDPEELSYVNGSPFVALDIEHPFSKYFFVEKDHHRANELRSIQREYAGSRNIEVREGDANQSIRNFLFDKGINWKSCRAVMFLDPFGMQVPWSTIEAIASTKGVETILNLPVGMAIQRLLPKSGDINLAQREMLNSYFGSAEWEELLYEKAENLFGDIGITKARDSGERLVGWYRKRLKKLFGFAPSPRLICNTKGSHLYYLFFAGPNETGAKIAAYILNQGQALRR
ncbi:MAG: three-Cys-motif partner protein TcmP [Alphaproteobacteria bacterium]|nr:three-Cys-motif partner protein TcmP [Alphaproteobacteria bacterium]